MKIAFVSTIVTAPWGGSEELWFQAAKLAIQEGHEISVFIKKWDNLHNNINYLKQKGAIVYCVKALPSLMQRVAKKVVKTILPSLDLFNNYRALQRGDFDVVVVTDGSTYYTADNRQLCELLLKSYKNKFLLISQANALSHRPSNWFRAQVLFNGAKQLVFVSEKNLEEAEHQLAMHLRFKSLIIQNPVLLPSFEKINCTQTDKLIHFGVIGRLSIAEKGQDIIIKALANEELKALPIKIHFYGAGVDEPYLRALAKYYDVEKLIVFEGYSNDRKKMWESCSHLLMCSHIEGTPLTVLEAIIAGKVCVVPNVGGNAEWVKNGINGFVFENSNEKDLTKAILNSISTETRICESSSKENLSILRNAINQNPGQDLLKVIKS